MVDVPSVETVVGQLESDKTIAFASELLRVPTTLMLGHIGMTAAEAEVVESDMSVGQLQRAIERDVETIRHLQLVQGARRLALARLHELHKEEIAEA